MEPEDFHRLADDGCPHHEDVDAMTHEELARAFQALFHPIPLDEQSLIDPYSFF